MNGVLDSERVFIPKWPRYFSILPSSFFICFIYPITSLRENKKRLFWGPSFFVPLFGKFFSIVTIHDLVFKLYPNTQEFYAKFFGNRFINMSMNKSDYISTVSNITANKIIEIYPDFKNKIFISQCSTDFKKLSFETSNRYKWNFKFPKEKYILYVGSIEPRKNLITLINAFEEFAIINQDIYLVFVAPRSWKYKSFYKKLDKSIVKDKIKILNYVTDYDLTFLYKNSFFTVLPSYYEGFGLTAIEAMVLGSSLICTTESEIPYLFGKKIPEILTLFDPFNDNLKIKMEEHIIKDNNHLIKNEFKQLIPKWRDSSRLLFDHFKFHIK